MMTGIAVTVVVVFFLGAFSALFAGVFVVLADRQVRKEAHAKNLWEQILLILN